MTSFLENPAIFYDWLRPLLQSILEAHPNKAHFALAKLANIGVIKSIITQNIDILHQRAGSRELLEVHGSLAHFICNNCQTSIDFRDKTIAQYLRSGVIPRCANCENILKPDITLFEEMLPFEVWEKAYSACSKADLIIAVGTSLEVYPVNLLPELALDQHAGLIINTISSTHLDQEATLILPYDVVQVWEKIQAAFE